MTISVGGYNKECRKTCNAVERAYKQGNCRRRIVAEGLGATHPLHQITNRSRQNRRIEFVIL